MCERAEPRINLFLSRVHFICTRDEAFANADAEHFHGARTSSCTNTSDSSQAIEESIAHRVSLPPPRCHVVVVVGVGMGGGGAEMPLLEDVLCATQESC